MARPEKNTVDYFPFVCDEGKKMYVIEERYGNDGFATFVKLLRELATKEYHYLDLSEESDMMYLSSRCKVSREMLESIIIDLVNLGKFDREFWEQDRVIWCQYFIDHIQVVYEKRKNNCITKLGLRELLNGLRGRKPDLSQSDGVIKPQTKVKESKVKERETPARALDFLQTNFPGRFESEFLMKYKRKIQDYPKFCDDFNDKVDVEDLVYTEKILFARLGRFSRNWIKNQDKYGGNSQQSNSTSSIPVG